MKNPKNKIKAIIFDIGGVLFIKDTDKDIFISMAKLFEKGSRETEQAILSCLTELSVGKMSTVQFHLSLCSKLGRKVNYKRFISEWIKAYKIHLKMDIRVKKLISSLRKNYPVYAFTNTEPLIANYHKRKGHYKLFTRVFASCFIGMRKPHMMDKEKDPSKAYRYVCRKIRKAPYECIFIDDKKANLPPARMIGIKAIHFKNANQLKSELRKMKIKF